MATARGIARFLPSDPPRAAASRLRGVWIPERRHSPVLASAAAIREALDFLQALGFNAVFPAVWNRGLTAFPSRVMERLGLPAQDPGYGGFDPLAAIVREGRSRGLAVLPWFEYGFASSPEADGGPLLRARPHWAAFDAAGRPLRHGSLAWMNGLHPEVQQLLLDLMVEVVRTYDVAGIQGDDRWPALPVGGGHDPLTRASYRAERGQDPPAAARDAAWARWRADRLTDHLARVRRELRAARPGCLLSLAPAPPPFGLRELLQDGERWLRDGLADLLHPQLYRSRAGTYGRHLERLVARWPPSLRSRLAPGIALTAHGRPLPPAELVAMVRRNRRLGLAGEVFFHYGGLRRDGDAVGHALREGAGTGEVADLPLPFPSV